MERFKRFFVFTLIYIVAALTIGIFAREAQAHAVFIFAWVDGDRVCTESYFSKKNKVRGGKITMTDDKNRELQSGLTDDEGLFCFRPPQVPTNLIFVVEAGEGHRGEFRLGASEYGTEKPSGGVKAETSSAESSAATKISPEVSPSTCDAETMRRVIKEELQTQLSPIKKTLAENSEARGAGWREVIGGLGWLAGLAGLALYLASRLKRPS